MFRRYMLAGLTMLTLSIAAMADVHRDVENQVEAIFPYAVNRSTKSISDNAKVYKAQSRDNNLGFTLGIVEQSGVDWHPDKLKAFAKGFIQGITNAQKNPTILRQPLIKLNDKTPVGYSYVVKHDNGVLSAWATIENGKAYFVIIEGANEASLKSDTVKNFRRSVLITGSK